MLVARLVASFAVLAQLSPGVAGAWTHSPLANLPVSTAAESQNVPQMVLDGTGGTIVVWRDARGGAGTDDIYAHHVLGSGVLDPAWPVGGLLVCGAANFQDAPRIVTDGAGGAIVVWVDVRNGSELKLYARRVLASGANDPSWPVDGRALCATAGDQFGHTLAPDGMGGVIVVWQDYRFGATPNLYAAHVLGNGVLDSNWPVNGLAVVGLSGAQSAPAIVPDDANGAIVVWEDNRFGGSPDIFAQRLLSSGAVDPAWPTYGLLIDNSGASLRFPAIVTDAAGGAIVAWSAIAYGVVFAQHVLPTGVVDPAWIATGLPLTVSSPSGATLSSLAPDGAGGAIAVLQEFVASGNIDLVAHHVLGSGVVDPAWPASGRALCRATRNQLDARSVVDGAGGLFVAWRDLREGATADVYAHHLMASGIVDPAWPIDGRAVCTAPSDQSGVVIVPDLAGGVVIAWADSRQGYFDIYAQNITTFGVLGDPEPAIDSIGDLPNDQGGRVRIRWGATQMDAAPYYEIGSYGIWRQVTEDAAAKALARGARLAGAEPGGTVERGVYRAVRTTTQTTWWEGVGMVTARGEPGYTFVAETFQDSTAEGNPLTAFFVEARAATPIGWWDSAPVSGYSVDNLAPAAPAPFTGQYTAGTACLHWDPNVERDFAAYRLYRGASSSFVPGPGNLVAALADTGYTDAAGQKYVYKLSAVDLHGNESPVATLEFPEPTDVGDGVPPRELSFASPKPNPATALSTLRYALPRESRVRLAVYDAAGRLVREVASGIRAAGAHAEAWDLRDGGGRAVGPGLYFARLEVAGHAALTRRIAVAR